MIDYVTISGSFISELQQSSQVSSDLMMIGKSINGKYCERSADYGTLSSFIYDNLSSYMNLRSMVYQQSSDYSLVNHTHNQYNVVSVQLYDYTIDETYGKRYKIDIGEIVLDGNTYELTAPGPIINGETSAKIGQLKFIYSKQLSAIDIDSTDFDGWVYPDGSEYSSVRFPDASIVFGDQDGQTFRVPCLSSFLYMNGTPQNGVEQSMVQTSEVIPEHSHSIQGLQLNGNATGCFQYPQGTSGGYKSLHVLSSGDKIVKTGYFPIALKMSSITIRSQNYVEESQEDGVEETLPKHMMMPVMIYIGGV